MGLIEIFLIGLPVLFIVGLVTAVMRRRKPPEPKYRDLVDAVYGDKGPKSDK